MRGPQVLSEPALPSNLDRRVDVTIVFDIRPACENRGRAAAIIGKGRWTVLLITRVRASGILAQAVVDHIRCRIVVAGFGISAVRHARPDMKRKGRLISRNSFSRVDVLGTVRTGQIGTDGHGQCGHFCTIEHARTCCPGREAHLRILVVRSHTKLASKILVVRSMGQIQSISSILPKPFHHAAEQDAVLPFLMEIRGLGAVLLVACRERLI